LITLNPADTPVRRVSAVGCLDLGAGGRKGGGCSATGRGKEIIVIVVWEKMTWLNKYVQNAGSAAASNE
jgi:hypothetical protein